MTKAEKPREGEDRNELRAGAAYGTKASLVVAALACLVYGLYYTRRGLQEVQGARVAAPLSRFAQWLAGWARDRGVPDAVFGRAAERALWNVAIFLVLVIVIFAARPVIARFFRGTSEGGAFFQLILLTRNSRTTGVLVIGSAVAGACFATWALLAYQGLVPYLAYLPLIAGLAIAVAAIGAAIIVQLPMIVTPAVTPYRQPETRSPGPEPARITGEEFLERLRKSPIFRRQIHFDTRLQETRFIGGASGRDQLLRRYPRLEPVLEEIGIHTLSSDQTFALNIIQNHEESGKPHDYVFVGHPGSGRTTLANMLALGAALQKEGAIYCITPESPDQAVEFDTELNRRAVRHAATQLREWIDRSDLGDIVNVSESYRATDPPRDIDSNADIVVTDARVFSRSNEARAARLLSRLRYVVVDQPERLSREDFVKLRIALCRLRLVAEMIGRPLTYIVIVPRLNNSAEVAKYLLNHSNIETLNFGAWNGPCRIVGWLPALEIADLEDDEGPQYARASFIDEVRALLAQIGALANELPEQIRVAVIDQQPLLGPEAREQIREAVRDQIARQSESPAVMRAAWTYFTGNDIGVERQGEFDVIVTLGAGRYPNQAVASVRPALAASSAMITVADSSPADLDTFDVMAVPSWSPETEGESHRYPTLLLPDHSDAVVAYELARLFEDFETFPFPLERLLQVFPGQGVRAQLEEWRNHAYIGATQVFEDLYEGTWPRRRECLERTDRAFRGDLYEIPWGCCSREVYDIYDRAANRQVAAGAYLNDWIDADRLFIDFHPMAALRYRPNTVLVAKATPSTQAPDQSDRRFIHKGTVEIHQMQRDDAIRIDRRLPRITASISLERPPHSSSASGGDQPAGTPDLTPLLAPSPKTSAALRPLIGRFRISGAPSAPLTFVGGEWHARIHERVRDVVRTDARLVEEPTFTTAVALPPGSLAEREYDCVVMSLFLEEGEALRAPRNNVPEPEVTPVDAVRDYPSLHALSRAMAEYLRREFLGFDREFRVTVLRSTAKVEHMSSNRIVIYKLRSNELGWEHTLASMLEPEDLADMLQWALRRLESCDCPNGCSRCCGGLGTIPVHAPQARHFTDADEISRSGAYELACGLLGRSPDWARFREASMTLSTDEVPTERQLQRLVDEMIGTTAGNYQDGMWQRLFGFYLQLSEKFIAPAAWIKPGSPEEEQYYGYYLVPANQVFIRADTSLAVVRETILHEYVHNWQFQSDRFDLETHLEAPLMSRYFAGNLVIEGHAVWSEHLYRLFMRRGPVYTIKDRRPWDEYKAGFFVMEGIEKTVGQDGLFAWLMKGPKSPNIRSRDPRLVWPFTIDQVLDKLNLRRYVRAEGYTDWDVNVVVETATEPPAPPAIAPPATEPLAIAPPANEPVANEPPANEPLASEPPANESPANEPPANEPPANEPPAIEPPANQPPVLEPPLSETPVTEPPVTEPPVGERLVNVPPSYESPVNETPVNESPGNTGTPRVADGAK